jgi:hypothetical protein
MDTNQNANAREAKDEENLTQSRKAAKPQREKGERPALSKR